MIGGAPPGAGPEVTGQFAPPVTWPLVPVHIATLSNGKIAVWDGFDAALNSERVWDPATGQFDPIPSGRNLFCAAHVTLPDGRLFIAGGHIEANVGLKDTHIYNPSSRTWFRGTDMARGALVPDRDDAARRAHPRRLGRQHHAQRPGPADAAEERRGDAAGDLQRRHEHVDAAAGRPAPDAAVPVHVPAAGRRASSTPGRTCRRAR